MWQGSNGAASVPQPPSLPASQHRSLPLLALHPTIPRLDFLPVSLDPCHRAPHRLPAHQPMPTQTTFANPSPLSSSARQSTRRMTSGNHFGSRLLRGGLLETVFWIAISSTPSLYQFQSPILLTLVNVECTFSSSNTWWSFQLVATPFCSRPLRHLRRSCTQD